MDSLEQLLKKQQELAAQIDAARHKQKKEGMDQILALVEKYQLAPKDVVSAITKKSVASGKKRGHVAPKYRNPATGATWTGRGKPPAWIAGKNRDTFLIR